MKPNYIEIAEDAFMNSDQDEFRLKEYQDKLKEVEYRQTGYWPQEEENDDE